MRRPRLTGTQLAVLNSAISNGGITEPGALVLVGNNRNATLLSLLRRNLLRVGFPLGRDTTFYITDEGKRVVEAEQPCDACQQRRRAVGLPWCEPCARRDTKAHEETMNLVKMPGQRHTRYGLCPACGKRGLRHTSSGHPRVECRYCRVSEYAPGRDGITSALDLLRSRLQKG